MNADALRATPPALCPPRSTGLDLATLRAAYRAGTLTPVDVVERVLAAIGDDPHRAWIHVQPAEVLRAQAQALMQRPDRDRLPLYGIPFAIKDNIDLAGVPTTAACPAFSRVPPHSATVVQLLIDAGALPIGKTNMDQFATGLNGTRSPHGACLNAFDPRLISGGSSSGSAVSVALGHASFSLGTDTAGSGRVPAAFNQLVGLKPSLGLLSTTGVLPACRTLDAVSIFALHAEDAREVFEVVARFDDTDPFSRRAPPPVADFNQRTSLRLGVPQPHQRRFTDPDWARGFEQALAQARAMGLELVPIDIDPLLQVARLLYEGPWLAERYQAIREFVDAQPEALWPVTRDITLAGATPSAADAFAAHYRLKALSRQSEALWQQVDALLMPTAPGHPTIEAVLQEPVLRNSELGWYTNFVNLLDLSAVAVPCAQVGDLPALRPFGITLMAPAHHDRPLLTLAHRWHRFAQGLDGVGPPPQAHPVSDWVKVAVCGAHLSGQPLHGQLTSRGARLVATTTTAPCYHLHALADGLRPGLSRSLSAGQGAAIEVEVWELPTPTFGSFVAGIPAPLGIGRTLLADGSQVCGFICEPIGLQGALDITAFGGWRAWRASQHGALVP